MVYENKLKEELAIIAANIDIKCFRCKAVRSFKISDLLSFESMYQFAFAEFNIDKEVTVDLGVYI